MFTNLIAALTAVSLVSGVVLQNPLAQIKTVNNPFGKAANPYDTYVDHFDSHRVGTDVYLQTHIAALYPNESMTVTQDRTFQLLAYAAKEPTGRKIMVKQMDNVEVLKRAVYIPSMRRRDGDGIVAEQVTFAGYDVAWGNEEFKAIVGAWADGFAYYVQWHIIGNEQSAQQLIHDCSAFTSSVRNAVWVYDQSYWKPDYALWQSIQKASWEDVVLEDKLKKSIQNDYRSFFKSEEIYEHLGVPWKRGLIFLGPPGNGKTISLKAIMKEVKVPLLYVKSFHSYAGDEGGIRMVFQHARAYAPCVLVLEDLDSLITDSNRAFFLNEVDGLEDNDGLLLIGSTNHFDRLDPALSSRPSRFDRKYNFPNPNQVERKAYAQYWQDKLKINNPELKFPNQLVDDFAGKTGNFSFAYMKEAFISSLLLIAGQEPGEEFNFGQLLLDQVDKLREQIDSGGESIVGTFGTSTQNKGDADMSGLFVGMDAGPGEMYSTGEEEGQEGAQGGMEGLLISAGQTVFGTVW